MTSEVSADEEIDNPRKVRPHLVLLGAGASRAATPNGDAAGRRLPVMADFVEIVGLAGLLDGENIEWRSRNFEEVYSDIAGLPEQNTLRTALESAVEQYFLALSLPSSPTIYDYLVLNLRTKDVIATFNWDPFLIQAYRRSLPVTRSLPYLVFLHGSVAHGFCVQDQISGARGSRCSRCGKAFTPDRLLFPVSEKNYSNSPEIAFAWDAVRHALEKSLMFTIFGYGAPKSDRDAIDLMKAAWGDVEERQFEQIEIIDVRSENQLLESWSDFIHTHHYDVFNSLHDSFLAKHPRRSIEAFQNQYLDAMFIEENPAPLAQDLTSLHSWYSRLVQAELASGV